MNQRNSIQEESWANAWIIAPLQKLEHDCNILNRGNIRINFLFYKHKSKKSE